jgi:polyribonucleotide 5'-hydroxyl-kinase
MFVGNFRHLFFFLYFENRKQMQSTQSTGGGGGTGNRREHVLLKEHELRCEARENEWLTVKLLTGVAEIFGVELAQNKEYNFRDQNFAIFTWYGCTIETSGDSSVYIADSAPMVAYVNTHIQLEARRDVALANNDFGPRVRILKFLYVPIVM